MLDLAHGDRFEIRRELGAGGMGRVYEALDRDRNALVALKTLQQASPGAIARFKAEFRSLAGLVHPNLVTLYELVVAGDRAFYTMELVDGVHFDRWVRPVVDGPPDHGSGEETHTAVTRQIGPDSPPDPIAIDRGRLDLRRLRRALRQLAEGVTAIHDAGKLHRDLKPSNVMVTPSGRVVVLDFGLVADLEAESADRRVLEGTASYMSPEQGARARLAPSSDWYALGVILYRALTGRMPFIGGREDVLMEKQQFEPARPSEIATDVPTDLDALCAELLRRDPHRRPSGADILRRLGSKMVPSRQPVTFSTIGTGGEVLVGRQREVEFLDQAWRGSLEGQPILVHVRGKSGMGKSRVVRAFLDNVGRNQQQVLVLRGKCYEAESLPFKAVDTVIDALARHLAGLEEIEVEGLMPRDAMALARVFPALRQVSSFNSPRRREVTSPDPQELRRRAFGALRELLARLSDRDPLVIAIDDVQWGDIDSADLLAALLRPPDAPAIMLVSCWRSEAADDSPFLATLRKRLIGQRVDIRELSIGRLSPDETRELALLHIGPRDGVADLAARIASESGGSPFFVEEMARHVRDARGEVDVSLEDALRHRVAKLPDEAAHLLSVIALAGRPIPQTLAIRASGVTDPAMMSLLKAGSFVKPRSVDGARYVEVYHDRIRETALGELDDDALRARHLRLAHMYEASSRPDPEILAAHYAGAGERMRAAELAVDAGRRAMESLAFERAATLFRTALDLAPSSVDRAVRVELGDALVCAGRGPEAAEAYEAAIAGASKAEALDLRCRAAGQLLYSGRIEDGLARLGDVIDEVGMKIAATPRRALMSFVWNRARLRARGLGYRERDEREVPASQLMEVDVTFAVTEGLGFSDPIRGADFHGRSVLRALRCGEPIRIQRAIAAEAAFSSLRGIKARRRTEVLIERMGELTERAAIPSARAIDVGVRGLCAFNFGDFDAAVDLCEEAERVFREECVGFRFERGATQLYQCFAMALGGRVKDMVRKFPRLVKEAYERGDLFLATNLRAALGVYVPLLQDDAEAAYREVSEAMAGWPQGGFHLPHCNALGALAYTDMYRGDGMAAYRRVEEAWPALVDSKLLLVQMMRALSWGTRGRAAMWAYRTAGDRRARAIAVKARRLLMREKVGYAVAMGLLVDAGLAYADGNRERAVEVLARAEQVSEDAGVLLHAKAARWSRGFVVGGDEGTELRRTAGEVFRAEGAVHPEGVARIFAPIADF